MLGQGPNATYDFGNASDFLHFDNFYLLALFRGGVPLLLSYVVLVLVPAVLGLSRGWSGPGLCAALILVFWGVMLGGVSTFVAPFLTFYNFVVYLLVGRCYLTMSQDMVICRGSSLGCRASSLVIPACAGTGLPLQKQGLASVQRGTG
jgi:O-antigen ligase